MPNGPARIYFNVFRFRLPNSVSKKRKISKAPLRMNTSTLNEDPLLSMNVLSGVCPKDLLQIRGGIWLIHGGAGPADPKGLRAQKALERIRSIADEGLCFSSQEKVYLTGFQASHLHQRAFTQAEKIALFNTRLLENEPLYNAGFGSALQADGSVRVSASYMESSRQVFSSLTSSPA
jgi:hypothetical protein